MVSKNQATKKRRNPAIKVGFAIHDAKYDGNLVNLYYVSYGDEKCACGHPIAWVYVVENELAERTIYGSDCIAKLYLFKQYGEVDAETYSKLYNKFHKLFVKFGKLVWKATKFGLTIPELPKNEAELENAVTTLKAMVSTEYKRRKTLWKKLADEHANKIALKKARKAIVEKYPFFKVLFVAYKRGFRFMNGNNKDYTDFVKKFFGKWERGWDFILTDPQIRLANYLVSLATGNNTTTTTTTTTTTNGRDFSAISEAINAGLQVKANDKWLNIFKDFLASKGYLSRRQVNIASKICKRLGAISSDLTYPSGGSQ